MTAVPEVSTPPLAMLRRSVPFQNADYPSSGFGKPFVLNGFDRIGV
jgi:hypothetical protein